MLPMRRRADPTALAIVALASFAGGLMLAPLTWREIPQPGRPRPTPAPVVTLHPDSGDLELPDDTLIRLPWHARARYVITEIGADGNDAPTLASWTVTPTPAR